ncbi:MAG: hypothetical protein LBJ31_01765 [Treponema sp.]|nr:hypothetical protein [Treponema sp.]
MKNSFRPVEFWKSSLMTLPDNAFFVLMRSVLGVIKTPFNKQNLLEDLSIFLSRADIQKTMATYIDPADRWIISAIALLDEPCEDDLERFFSIEFSYVQLHALLLNLEERHILYRFWDDKKSRLALNPKLKNILEPIAEDKSFLFQSSAAGEKQETPLMTGRILAALFAFFLQNIPFYRNGSLRKKTLAAGKSVFPWLDLEEAAGALITLGLFKKEGEYLRAVIPAIESFAKLDERDCFEYYAAGLACNTEFSGGEYVSRSSVKLSAKILHNVADMIENGALYPGTTLVKLLELERRTENAKVFNGFQGALPSPRALLNAAVSAGIITGSDPYRLSLLVKNRPEQSIAVDSNFSFILYPEILFKDALAMAFFCTIDETDSPNEDASQVVRFSITRDSVIRGMDQGCSAKGIYDLVNTLSGGKAGETLKFNLDDWEKRCREVTLCEGVVLSLSGDRAYLAESALKPLISRRLDGGVYLLNVDLERAAQALSNAGVDVVSRPGGREHNDGYGFLSLGAQAKHESLAGTAYSPDQDAKKSKKTPDNSAENAESAKQKFRLMLAEMKLGKPESEELLARIERRVVVSESQLKDTSVRYEKLEARSLDYVGKSSIARQALASGSLVEAVWTAGKTEQKCLGVPQSIDKKGGELILVLKPRSAGEPVSIPLGKISLLRRIKQSIFGE